VRKATTATGGANKAAAQRLLRQRPQAEPRNTRTETVAPVVAPVPVPVFSPVRHYLYVAQPLLSFEVIMPVVPVEPSGAASLAIVPTHLWSKFTGPDAIAMGGQPFGHRYLQCSLLTFALYTDILRQLEAMEAKRNTSGEFKLLLPRWYVISTWANLHEAELREVKLADHPVPDPHLSGRRLEEIEAALEEAKQREQRRMTWNLERQRFTESEE
jgi:hypothetical protein